MDDFYELAKLCHQDRINAEQDKLKDLDNQASVLYNTFCIWSFTWNVLWCKFKKYCSR